MLYFVKGEWSPFLCYFTAQPLDKQWGDDWHDAPHFCNAGEPYDGPDGLLVVDGAALPNGPHSVQAFNSGEVPWLVDGCSWEPNDKVIHAGTTMRDFITKCREYGWQVYWPLEG